MSEAPERIVTSQCGKTLVHDGMKRFETDVEYIRKDVSDALIAASVEASADLILQRAHNYYSKPGDAQSGVRTFASAAHDWLLEDVLNTDARQALDALLKAEREKALREAAEVCTYVIKNYDVMEPGKPDQFASLKTQKAAKGMVSLARQDILALISEVATKEPSSNP